MVNLLSETRIYLRSLYKRSWSFTVKTNKILVVTLFIVILVSFWKVFELATLTPTKSTKNSVFALCTLDCESAIVLKSSYPSQHTPSLIYRRESTSSNKTDDAPVKWRRLAYASVVFRLAHGKSFALLIYIYSLSYTFSPMQCVLLSLFILESFYLLTSPNSGSLSIALFYFAIMTSAVK